MLRGERDCDDCESTLLTESVSDSLSATAQYEEAISLFRELEDRPGLIRAAVSDFAQDPQQEDDITLVTVQRSGNRYDTGEDSDEDERVVARRWRPRAAGCTSPSRPKWRAARR